MLTIVFASAALACLTLGGCAIAACMLSSQNSRRLEQMRSQQLQQPPMASGF